MCTYIYSNIYYFGPAPLSGRTDDSLHSFGSSKTCSFSAAFYITSLNRFFTSSGSLPRNSRKALVQQTYSRIVLSFI